MSRTSPSFAPAVCASAVFFAVVLVLSSPVLATVQLLPPRDLLLRQTQSPDCAQFLNTTQTCLRTCLADLIASGTCTSGDCCAVANRSNGTATLCVNGCCFSASLNGGLGVNLGSNSTYCTAASSRGNGTNTTGTNTTSNSSSSCFPSDARVRLPSGEYKRMDQLNVGDRVQVGPGPLFSDVFMFTHRAPHVKAAFLTIRASSGHVVRMTPGHYMHLNGVLAPASSATVGDALTLEDGSVSSVVSVTDSVQEGLYNPQTLHGDIVIDGVLASTYTTAVAPSFGHAWLAPVRALYSTFGWSGLVLVNGAESVANALPSGRPVY